MISIVLPTFNGEKYLAEAIESILVQTYEAFELIIIDDCSSDSTAEIIKMYSLNDDRIRYFRNSENKKLPCSLNIGFSYARGDYFTWTSDDNIFYKDALKTMKAALDEDRSIDLVFAREDIIDENGKNLGPALDRTDLDELYCRNIMSPCFLYKKEIHDELQGYDTSKYLIEDYDFWLRAYRKFNFKYISKRLYGYRIHSGSLTSLKYVDVREKRIEILKETLKLSDINEHIKTKIIREISNSYLEISQYYADLTVKHSKNEIRYLQMYSFKSQIRSVLRGIKRRIVAQDS